MNRLLIALTVASVALAVAVFLPGVARAAGANDDFDSASVVASLPYSDTVDISGATAAADDPTACSNNGSMWYAYTATEEGTLVADTFGSNYDTVLSAYTGSRGALSLVPAACNDDYSGLQSRISFHATAGTTYYFLVAFCCGTGGTAGGGTLHFDLQAQAAPSNDNFADATPVGSLPYSQTVDLSTATTQTGEQSPCGGTNATVWYSYTPSVSGSLSASATGNWWPAVAIYTDSSLGDLSVIGCRAFGSLMTFHADAGTTYYFQLAALYGNAGPATFNLSVAPDPQANFWYWPGDPSTYDTIQFSDASYDPGQVGIQAEEWAFGDGSTATGCCPTHRYSADNDYTATLTVATSDGRHASIRRTIHVQTHDVAITKLLAPQSASAGQTRQISVGVASNRYPEDVQVQLVKALPGGGYAVIGTLTQSVPVRSSNRTTSFDFSYTFTSDDASVGKVTFKAVASIVGARDALPGDNELVADPTKVTR